MLSTPRSTPQSTPRPIIYLACPYTHTSAAIRLRRFNLATLAAAHLIKQGNIVYSPITMTHPIDVVLSHSVTEGTLGSDYWTAFDEAFMDVCAEMVILKIDGWDRSRGIAREAAYFKAQGKLVGYITLGPALIMDVALTSSLCQVRE